MWRGIEGPAGTAVPTLAPTALFDARRRARSMAICTPDEAIAFVTEKTGTVDWIYIGAHRSTEEQITRWVEEREPTDPASEISQVLWVVGGYASQPLTYAQFYGWAFPGSDEGSSGRFTGMHDVIYAFTEDGHPVLVDKPQPVRVQPFTPDTDYTPEEYIAELQRLSELPEVPSQIEGFPNLSGICSMSRD